MVSTRDLFAFLIGVTVVFTFWAGLVTFHELFVTLHGVSKYLDKKRDPCGSL
jgi:hypothetical protein